MEEKNKIIPRQKSEDQERGNILPGLVPSGKAELLKLVEMGDKEISEGRGYSLESVLKAADNLLKDDES